MTDGEAGFQPGQGESSAPVRPRSAFVAHEVFGHGSGAVLVEPEVARDLRTAAEFAGQERRITGGLLYGRPWADDDGQYLVVDGFLEAGPGENPRDRLSRDGRDSFALSDPDLRLLREDAARMYSAALEVGWWRSLPGPGEFGPRDYESQRELVGPGGVGLLVFGSGLEWGTAYLGPDGQAPGSARSFIPVPRPATEPPLPTPRLDAAPSATPGADAVPEDDDLAGGGAEPAAGREPQPVTAAAPGTSLTSQRQPALTPAPKPAGPPVISPIRVPARQWGEKKTAIPSYAGPRWPTDVKIVVGSLIVTGILAAVIVAILVSNALIGVGVAVVLLIALAGFLWLTRL